MEEIKKKFIYKVKNDDLNKIQSNFYQKSKIKLERKIAEGRFSLIYEGEQNEKKFCVKLVII